MEVIHDIWHILLRHDYPRLLCLPETAKKSLEEMDMLFNKNVPAWRSAATGATFEEKVEEVRRTGGIRERKADAAAAAHEEDV